MSTNRRSFLSSIGVLSAAGLLPRAACGATPQAARGLGAEGDFAFAPGLVYLQTGSLGPTPRPVIDKTVAVWRQMELDPAEYAYGEHERAMEGVRAAAAAFLGCQTGELVLTNCTTEGMNWIAQGLTWAPGDRVLTTDQEHPGGRVCWDYVARRNHVALDIVPIVPGEHDAKAIVDRFSRAITPRTKVLSFSHVLTSTGLCMPVRELSALARNRGCLAIVDGAQATGGIAVNVKTLGCHAYATSGHKWLLGPKGTGLLYLSEELGHTIDPIALQSGRAAYSASSGVCSIPSVLGLGAALDYLSAIGPSRVEAHNLALRDKLFAALQEIPTLRVVSPGPGPLASPLLAYRLSDSIPAASFRQRLRDRHNIEVKLVPREWFNGNRISTHLFNTDGDVAATVAALRAELA